MDLADEIAYAAHDLEDALSRNMVTIEDIEYEFQISDEFRGAREQFRGNRYSVEKHRFSG